MRSDWGSHLAQFCREVRVLPDALDGADVVLLAVGTPIRQGDGYADLTYIFQAVDSPTWIPNMISHRGTGPI